jgi:hypothetical protein
MPLENSHYSLDLGPFFSLKKIISLNKDMETSDLAISITQIEFVLIVFVATWLSKRKEE